LKKFTVKPAGEALPWEGRCLRELLHLSWPIALSMLSPGRTPQEEDGVRALLEEASRLSWQIDWHEGVELAERQMEGLRTVRSLP